MEPKFFDGNRGNGVSILELKAIGIVSKHEEGSDVVQCYIPEIINDAIEDAIAYKEVYSNDITDIRDESRNSTVSSTANVNAEWFPLGGSQRLTPPDVVVGEHVLLFSYGDGMRLRWTSLGQRDDLRNLEHIELALSNEPELNKEWDETSSYRIIASTKKKRLGIHTTDNDGEVCAWDISLDTKEGVLGVGNSNGDSFVIDAKERSITTTTVTFNVNATTSNFSGDVNIKGATTMTGSVKMSNTLSVVGPVDFTSMLTSGGVMTGTLGVTGGGAATVSGSLVISGNIAAANWHSH